MEKGPAARRAKKISAKGFDAESRAENKGMARGNRRAVLHNAAFHARRLLSCWRPPRWCRGCVVVATGKWFQYAYAVSSTNNALGKHT